PETMPGCDADYGSQIAVDHHRPVCLRGLGAMKECPPSLPRAADNLPLNVRKASKHEGFPITARKHRGDVVQLVRTLLSHRHNDISDLKISNLVQPTSVRPVTVSAISLHFRKLVVRF